MDSVEQVAKSAERGEESRLNRQQITAWDKGK